MAFVCTCLICSSSKSFFYSDIILATKINLILPNDRCKRTYISCEFLFVVKIMSVAFVILERKYMKWSYRPFQTLSNIFEGSVLLKVICIIYSLRYLLFCRLSRVTHKQKIFEIFAYLKFLLKFQ